MSDSFSFTLHSPLTDDEWDMITDVDFEHTNEITFYTKHGKEVRFFKASADVVPVVRCKDCKYRNGDYCHNYDGFAHFDHFFVQMDDYCSRGARLDGDTNAE